MMRLRRLSCASPPVAHDLQTALAKTHRSYHALPKSIRRRGDKPAGAILGFANMLIRLYREEQPRAVLVAGTRLKRKPIATLIRRR